MKNHIPYILGIDVGVASLGLALIGAEDPSNIIAGIVRTYTIPEGAAERRTKRAARRLLDRRNRRLDRLSDLLFSHGIGYRRRDAPQKVLNYSPIKARARASREQVDLNLLSRALLHIAKNRGSSAFDHLKIEDKDRKITAKAMKSLVTEMDDKGFTTYGQYLRSREKQHQMTTIDQDRHKERYGEYAFYPNRDLLKKEFEIIWDQQAKHYQDILTPILKQKVKSELFYQRSVTFPPIGDCPYFKGEEKLPKASRLFQLRRIYEECNNLRFYDKYGKRLAYSLTGRNLLVEELKSGQPLTAAKIKKLLGFDSSTKVNMEKNSLKENIKAYPFDMALGDEKCLGQSWLKASSKVQDSILDELATQPDNEKLIKKISALLECSESKAGLALTASLPSGRGRMGVSATQKILAELTRALVTSREAEDLAGISHAMSADEEVWSRLPYYGKVLLGHTQPAIWVSDYRKQTDTPPNTSPEEKEYGRVPNPVVHLALNQIRKTINRVIDEYGLPEKVYIELARDLNKSKEQREVIVSRQKANQKANKNAKKKIRNIDELIDTNRINIRKYRLWEEQKYTCVYTGQQIGCAQLYDGSVDIDHILPRSKVASNAFANQVVCLKGANAAKSNCSPYQAFSNDKDKWAAIMRRVNKLSPAKQKRFTADAMEEYENDPSAWAARYGTDNAYIARMAKQYLSALFGGDQTKIVCVSSYIVNLLREKWGLQNILGRGESGKKYRGDHRHHFIDALVIANANRSMVQSIQTEAARCEDAGLEEFVDRIPPPFGEGKEFFNAVKKAAETKVKFSRKMEHSASGQMHEDRLLGIVTDNKLHTPDKNGFYLCRKKISLKDYNDLASFNKVKIQKTVLALKIAEVERAHENLEIVKGALASYEEKATNLLNDEQNKLSAAEKSKNKITASKKYKKALEIGARKGLQKRLTIFEKRKLVNIKKQHPSNTPQAGYIAGRNYRIDFYVKAGSKLSWECISIIDANKIGAKRSPFVPESQKEGNDLLWSAYKDDIIEMDDPEVPGKRSLFTVAALSEKMTIVPIFDARLSTGSGIEKRRTYERRLKFFKDGRAQKVVLDEIGNRKFLYPRLE